MIIDGNQCCNSFPKTGSTGSLSLSLSWDSLHVHFIHIYCVTKAIFVWNYDATASRSRDVLHVFDIHLFSALQVGEWIWASCRPAPHLWPAETKCLLSLVPVFLPLQASLYKVSFPVRWLRNARSWQLLKSSVSIAGWGTKKKYCFLAISWGGAQLTPRSLWRGRESGITTSVSHKPSDSIPMLANPWTSTTAITIKLIQKLL